MKILVDSFGHRVFLETNTEIDYPYFCPQCDENLYGIECSELHVSDKEVYHVISSNGDLYLDENGNVLRQETNSDCSSIVWFDLDEYREVWKVDTIPTTIDILDIRGILADGRELVWNEYKKRRAGE